MDDQQKERVLFFEIEGLTYAARTCRDVDTIEKRVGFTYCPVCGGKRKWKNGQGYLEHDSGYTGDVH